MLTVTALSWGSNVMLGQLAVGNVSPMMLVAGRWFGVLILMILFARRHYVRDKKILRRHLPYLFAMGALGFTVFNALMYRASHGTSGLNIGILQGTIPIIVIVGSFLVYRDRVTWHQMLGVVITLAGVATVVSNGDLDRLTGLSISTGDLTMAAACLFYGGYTVMLRNRPQVSALGMFTVLAAAALVASIPLLAMEILADGFVWPTPRGWMVMLLATLFPSLVGQLFFINAVETIGPARAGVFVNLVPIFAAILVVFVLGETLHWYHVISLVLVLTGIWISERSGARKWSVERR